MRIILVIVCLAIGQTAPALAQSDSPRAQAQWLADYLTSEQQFLAEERGTNPDDRGYRFSVHVGATSEDATSFSIRIFPTRNDSACELVFGLIPNQVVASALSYYDLGCSGEADATARLTRAPLPEGSPPQYRWGLLGHPEATRSQQGEYRSILNQAYDLFRTLDHMVGVSVVEALEPATSEVAALLSQLETTPNSGLSSSINSYTLADPSINYIVDSGAEYLYLETCFAGNHSDSGLWLTAYQFDLASSQVTAARHAEILGVPWQNAGPRALEALANGYPREAETLPPLCTDDIAAFSPWSEPTSAQQQAAVDALAAMAELAAMERLIVETLLTE
jgi:hypothetical protein